MQLIYTPRSHFARKVRILMAGLGLEAGLVDAGNVVESDPAPYGPNPLMKVPTLVDGDRTVFESDHIAAYLVRRHDPDDRFGVLTGDPDVLNARAVMNGAMALEVELILAERSGLGTSHARFGKMRTALVQALRWLNANARVFGDEPNYLGFHLVAMWDHMEAFGPVALDDYPRLRERVTACSAWPFVAVSRPPR